jgi:hypothetical protein
MPKVIAPVVSPMADRVLSVADFCRESTLSRPSFYKEVEAGRLQVKRYGKRVLIDGAEFLRWKAAL